MVPNPARLPMIILKGLGIDNVKIKIVDKGALDCTLKAKRIEGAVYRSCNQYNDLGRGRCDSMKNPNMKRLRRTMMFLNAQKPDLLRIDIYKTGFPSCWILSGCIAENQERCGALLPYHALKEIDYHGVERHPYQWS